MASIVMAGHMLKNMKHAMVIYGVMLRLLIAGAAWADPRRGRKPSAATAGLPVVSSPNMEGKEVRLGPVASATWAAMTTATSNGSVNSMHDSLNPIAGLVPMTMMMLNVVFSGIGAGFRKHARVHHRRGVPRRPDGGANARIPRQESRVKEVKLAMIAILLHPLLICAGDGAVRGHGVGHEDGRQPRAARVQRDPLRVHFGRGQ